MKDYFKKSAIQLIMAVGYLIGFSITLAGVITMFRDNQVNSSLTIASLVFLIVGVVFIFLLVKLIKPNLYVWFKYTPVLTTKMVKKDNRVRTKMY